MEHIGRGAGLSGRAVRGGDLWRPHVRAVERPVRPAADLCPVAGRLLHVLDLFRLGRDRVAQRARLPANLSGPDSGVRAGLEAVADDRAVDQAAQHRLDRGLPVCALRQERGAGRTCGGDRGDRHRSLHLDPAQGRVGVAAGADRGARLVTRHPAALDRARWAVAAGRPHHGDFRHPVRHAAYRHDRAPGRHDPGDCGRIRWSSSWPSWRWAASWCSA